MGGEEKRERRSCGEGREGESVRGSCGQDEIRKTGGEEKRRGGGEKGKNMRRGGKHNMGRRGRGGW